ncbi:unnamed protein product [Coffea canephora]|uniref:SBP-type domain-containing protein n=2 Tax=Coffea TaxID=13442 RepID=A0A068UMK9_COFCA|nr:unnamed protein product [Coffea canephora]
MLDYEWGNPSAVMFTGDDSTQDADQNRQLFDPYGTQNFGEATAALVHQNAHYSAAAHHQHTGNPFHHPHDPQGQSSNAHFSSLFDPRAAYGASSFNPHHQASMLSLEPAGSTGFMVIPKSEPVVGGADFTAAGRIGLNLGGRTYFSSSEDDFVSRLYRRSRVVEPGSVNSPRCQAEGCNADLTNAKHYHRRHKVCEFHSKAATVIASGLTQRFCQQCSRFHLLSEFDNGKRSCRKRLADHNRRRRKSQQQQQQPNQEHCNTNSKKSPNDNTRSPPDSGAHSSSVTVAVSPPRISLDCFRQRASYQGGGAAATNSSASTSSLFFSDG